MFYQDLIGFNPVSFEDALRFHLVSYKSVLRALGSSVYWVFTRVHFGSFFSFFDGQEHVRWFHRTLLSLSLSLSLSLCRPIFIGIPLRARPRSSLVAHQNLIEDPTAAAMRERERERGNKGRKKGSTRTTDRLPRPEINKQKKKMAGQSGWGPMLLDAFSRGFYRGGIRHPPSAIVDNVVFGRWGVCPVLSVHSGRHEEMK